MKTTVVKDGAVFRVTIVGIEREFNFTFVPDDKGRYYESLSGYTHGSEELDGLLIRNKRQKAIDAINREHSGISFRDVVGMAR